MYELFSNRELANGFVFGIFIFSSIIYMLKTSRRRRIIFSFIKSVFKFKLVLIFILISLYGILIMLAFSNFNFWTSVYTKDSLIWIFFIGVPISFRAALKCKEKYYFRNIVIDNIKMGVLFEIFLNTISFNFIVEVFLCVFVSILSATLIYAERTYDEHEEEFKVIKFIKGILIFISLILIIFTVVEYIKTYEFISIIDIIVSIFIPIIFSALYIPIAYAIALYSKYETLFGKLKRIDFYKGRKIYSKYKINTFKNCGLSIRKICYFEDKYICNLLCGDISIDEAFERFRKEYICED